MLGLIEWRGTIKYFKAMRDRSTGSWGERRQNNETKVNVANQFTVLCRG